MSLRDQCPESAAFFDRLREVFGKDMIDSQIAKGAYRVEENGVVAGKMPVPKAMFELKPVMLLPAKKVRGRQPAAAKR